MKLCRNNSLNQLNVFSSFIILEFYLSLPELYFFPKSNSKSNLLRISVLADYTDVDDVFVEKSSIDHDSRLKSDWFPFTGAGL